jgi:hypothetical protein
MSEGFQIDESQNSELLMCRKIGCNRNVRNRVSKTELGRIVLNFINFRSLTNIKDVANTFFWVIVPFILIKSVASWIYAYFF